MSDVEYCEWMTGFPVKFYNFIASFETNGTAVEFYSDAMVEVDWGSGKFVEYDSGAVHGYQLNTHSDIPVIVRSSESVTEFRFGSGVDYDNGYLACHINKAFDLLSANKMCYRLESMHTFSFFGTNKVKDFSSAWEDCTELTKFEGMDTIEAVSFFRTWKNCNKLTDFPSIYSRVANTVEEAWMGCTAMVKFPTIGSELCTSFKNAWRGNTSLSDFPLIDTSSGTDFDGSWAYCVNLLSFPALDFSSATTMNETFAYNYKIKSLPVLNTPLCTSFNSTFEKNLALECIGGIDTRSIVDFTGELQSVDMFKNDCALVSPTETEQAEIMVGSYYKNLNDCYFDAGRSVFYVRAASTSATLIDGEYCASGESVLCSFEVIGNDFEVDWGDGIFMPYNEGTVTGVPIDTGIISIRSEENISQIKFTSDSYTSISFKRAATISSFNDTAKDLNNLLSFEITGNVTATTFDNMVSNCSSLETITISSLATALSMNSTFKGCIAFQSFGENVTSINIPLCTNFTSTFENCSVLNRLPTLITTVGELFTNMMKDCISLSCLFGIDTRNQTSTTGMFDNTTLLTRPNSNETVGILNPGKLYSNGGNCDTPFNMWFTHSGDVDFTTDVAVQVDKGDGNYVTAGPGAISFTPLGTDCYVYGDVTTISFDTNTFVRVAFYNADYITDMSQMFKDKTALVGFHSYGTSAVTTWEETFMGCTSLIGFSASTYVGATVFTGTFDGCAVLTGVGYMNTLDGTEFERMFKDCILLSLDEINTLNGNFSKRWVDCVPEYFDCATDSLICDPTHLGGTNDDVYQCSVKWDCTVGGDSFPCFGTTTMFENWGALQIPTEADRIAIQSKAHWKDGELL